MKTKLLLCLISLCAGWTINAQSDYIITQSLDTIYGKNTSINYQLERVSFKEGHSGTNRTYSPADLYGYEKDGIFFQAVTVQLQGEKFSWFLIKLVEGPASLFFAKDNKLYFIQKNGTFYPLEKTESFMVEGRLKEDKRYIGLLTSLYSDCPKVASKLKSLTFTSKSLTKITESYNSCIDPNFLAAPKQKLTTTQFGINGGITISKPLFYGSEEGGEPDDHGIGFTVGAEFLTSFKFSKVLFFQGGIFLTKNVATTNVDAFFSYVSNEIVGVYVQPVLKIGAMFPGKVVSPYFSAGISPSFPVADKFTQTVVRDSGPTTVTELDRSLAGEVAFPVCGGLMLNLFPKFQPFVEYQYEYNANLFSIHKIMTGIRF